MSKFSGLLDAKFHPPRTWVLDSKLTYTDEKLTDRHITDLKDIGLKVTNNGKVTAPAGLKTDMASVPRFMWWLIAPFDVARAAVIHDVLYSAIRKFRYHGGGDAMAERAKTAADLVFKHAMDDAEPPVPSYKKYLCYQAVNWFGASSIKPSEEDK
jgi:hypothetical protein